MITKKIYSALVLTFAYFFIYGQQATVSGKITDQKLNPVAGASIYLLNTNKFTISDTAGNFSLKNIAPGNYTFSISAVGYATIDENIQLPQTGSLAFNFQLTEANRQLDAVVVTAEKKEENVQQIPVSISVLTEKNIEEYRLWNSRELTAIVPNLYAGNPGDGRNVVSIRGITSTSYDPAVTTYIDGVNQFTLDTYIPQLFDVERIEVLKGPQGTLYGRNAMGGVINIITKQPGNKIDAVAEMNFGNFGEKRFTLVFRSPVIKDKLFFGVAGLYEGLDGFYYNKYTNSKFDKQHGAGANYYLKYSANPNWLLTLNVKHLANRNYGAFPLVIGTGEAFAHPFQLNQNAVTKLVDNIFNSSFSINHFGKGFTLSSQLTYQSNYRYYSSPIDGDFSPIDGVTIINNYGKKWNNVKVLTQEFKISSPAGSLKKLKWTGGAYFFYQDVPNKQATHFGKDAALVGSPDSNYSIINTTKLKNKGAALFGQLTQNLSDKIVFTVGIRYDYQQSAQEVLGEYQPDNSPSPVFATRPDTSSKASYDALSPMATVAYEFRSNSNAYARYSRGYRTGGFTQLSPDPSQPPLYPYKPEYSNCFEVGSKNTFFKNRLRANISFFYSIISNAQVPTLILPDAITITRNAGRLQSKGFEIETAATPIKGLETSYNFGYTDAKYATLKLSQNGSAVDLAGHRQVFTPDITSMLALQYGFPINSSQSIRLVVRGEWMYLGEQFFDLANIIRQSPYHLLNARVGIQIKRLELFFWERNLTDKRYIAYAYDFGAVHLGNPRTYGFTLRATYTPTPGRTSPPRL